MRNVVIDVEGHQKLRVSGTEHWASHGDAWLCTHDLLHHLPSDNGSVREELMTVGAQMWMGYHRLGKFAISGGEVEGGIIPQTTSIEVLETFLMPPVPPGTALPEEDVMSRFREVTETGFSRLIDHLHDNFFYKEDASVADAWVEKISGRENQANAAGWMAVGYWVAQQRFPDPDKALNLFNSLMDFLNHVGHFNAVHIEIDEKNYKWYSPSTEAAFGGMTLKEQAS